MLQEIPCVFERSVDKDLATWAGTHMLAHRWASSSLEPLWRRLRWISSLIRVIAWLFKQLGWQSRERSKMEKLFKPAGTALLPEPKPICYCSAMKRLDQRHPLLSFCLDNSVFCNAEQGKDRHLCFRQTWIHFSNSFLALENISSCSFAFLLTHSHHLNWRRW